MASTPVIQWLEGLFDDMTMRIRTGVTWTSDAAVPPLTVHVRPADRPTRSLPLHRDGVGDLRSFAVTVQEALNPLLGVSAPSCPAHGVALEPIETDDHVRWRCPEGDFSCAVGDYRGALWPPGPDDVDADLGSLLGHRLKRRGLLRGVAHWSVRRDEGMLVGTIALRPTADEAAIRDVAEPVALQVTHVEPIATKRLHEPADDTGPARRVLTISGPGAMRAARLEGILRRAGRSDDCDFLVEGRSGGHCVRVRLAPDHRRGDLEGPVVLDHTGAPFADDGDEVVCGGGFNPGSRVEGEPGVFVAGRLSVYEPETLE